jgi:osmotically-inducible protein OsmY
MARRTRWLLACYLAGGIMLTTTAGGWGQTGERPLQKIFGGGTAKSSPAKAAADKGQRRAEIDVELAWLADPITFPYFLEARVEGGSLSVRGYVPDKTVRDHALKLARVHTTYTIADNMREHPSLRVRLAKESPAQLQTAVVSTLKEALPRQYQKLQVQCAADGAVILRGPVASAEEKLAASHALRRLYGCSSVQNLTQIAGEFQAIPTRPPIVEKAIDPPVQGPSLLPPTKPAPTVKKADPVKEAPRAAGKIALSAEKIAKLQKRVIEVCDGAQDVKIEVTPMNKIRIELTVRSDDQITPFAGKVYGLEELTDYREALELFFTVGQQE